MTIHTVRAGETIYSIATQYGVDPLRLLTDNALPPDGALVVGQALVVLFPQTTYQVQPGDTLYAIALRFGVPVLTLYQNNWFLQGRPMVQAGSTLVISYQGQKLGSIAANGYAYPFIDETLLHSVLPYLTYLSPFTYGISAEGGLLPLNDCDLLSAAGRFQTATLMHLSTLTEYGGFDNRRSSMILNDTDLQQTLILEIIQTLRRRNFYGLDVDFEYVQPDEREKYTAFIRLLRDRLNPLGYPVVVALAPKTSDDQPGLLYEAHDYAALGEAANAVFLMTYEWGYTLGPPMAVAPLPQVRAVIEYALSRIAPEKILLGIPLYGYDWPLPYQKGLTRARSISPLYAVELARTNGVAIEYDAQAQAPFFRYSARDGRSREVWFEDARSIDAKLRLIPEYGLAGVGYWNLMRPFPQNWLLLNSLFSIEKVLS